MRNVWIQKYQIIGSEIAQTEGFFGRLAGGGMALWFYLGIARAAEKKFAEAEAQFQAVLKIKPDDADAHAHYGSMLAGLGRSDEAASHLREAIRLRPEIGTRLDLAAVYRAAGKFREAIE